MRGIDGCEKGEEGKIETEDCGGIFAESETVNDFDSHSDC